MRRTCEIHVMRLFHVFDDLCDPTEDCSMKIIKTIRKGFSFNTGYFKKKRKMHQRSVLERVYKKRRESENMKKLTNNYPT